MAEGLIFESVKDHLEKFYLEDDFTRNAYYLKNLPAQTVHCSLKFKSDMILSGLPFFISAFKYLGFDLAEQVDLGKEGKWIKSGEVMAFDAPFDIVLSAERIALNLLQRSSSIASLTKRYVEVVDPFGIKILDTRKTTPGLRWLDKYSVRMGGGENHRFGQMDTWMIKDNHKACLGGLEGALNFFQSQGLHYASGVVEIHSQAEYEEAISLGVKNVMLDNFEPALIKEIVQSKPQGIHVEISGGLSLETLPDYCFEGVDAMSIGKLTYEFPMKDISLKYSI